MKKLLLLAIPSLLLAGCGEKKIEEEAQEKDFIDPTNQVTFDEFTENYNFKCNNNKFIKADTNNMFDWVGSINYSSKEEFGSIANGVKTKEEEETEDDTLSIECDADGKVFNYLATEIETELGEEDELDSENHTLFAEGLNAYLLDNIEKEYQKYAAEDEYQISNFVSEYYKRFIKNFTTQPLIETKQFVQTSTASFYIDGNVYTVIGTAYKDDVKNEFKFQITFDNNKLSIYAENFATATDEDEYEYYSLIMKSNIEAKNLNLKKPSLEGYKESK